MVINDGSTFFKVHMIIEWAKLCAFMPFLLTCLLFLRASFFLRVFVLIFYVPYVSIFLRPLRAFSFLRALCPDLLYSLRVHLFTCITCLHFFTCFQFLTCIMCVHFLNNKWNNLQQTASSWNKRERGRINQK